MRHQRRRRPRRDPILMGEPSPSLSRIQKMNMAALAERIERLAEEIGRLNDRIARLKEVDPIPTDKIEKLGASVERLTVLHKTAKERLQEKVERKARWDERNR